MKNTECCNQNCRQGRDCPLRKGQDKDARIGDLEALLALADARINKLVDAQSAQEVPYAVLVFERGEEGPFDRKPVKPNSMQHLHAKRDPHYDYVELYTHPTQQAAPQAVQPFGYVNTYTGQFLQDVEPCRQNNEGHWRTVYTHPTQQGLADDGMYYLQDARWSGMVGNCPSFWREGGGYTTNLDEAERFTFEAAMKQHNCRDTDLPWLCAEVDKLRRPTVDCQYMPRSWDDQRAALAAQAKQGGV